MALLGGLLLFVVGALAPGLALARLLVPDGDWTSQMVLGTALGVFALPFLHFSLAVLLGTNFNAALILGVAAPFLMAGGLVEWKSRQGGN